MYDSFVRYQSSLIQVFDDMAGPYGFEVIDASQSADRVFEALQSKVSKVLEMPVPVKRRVIRKPAAPVARVASITKSE
jgi:hypothetical protein